MHGMLIGFHEASHGLLRKNRLLNEIDGIIIGTVSLMSFSLYRAAHQLHHAYLASERDEELWPFVHPEKPRWFRVSLRFSNSPWGCFSPRFFFSAHSSAKVHRFGIASFADGYGWSSAPWRWCGPLILSAVAWFDLWKYLLWLHLIPGWLAGEHAEPAQIRGARGPHRIDSERLDAQHRGGWLGCKIRDLHPAARAVSRRASLALRACRIRNCPCTPTALEPKGQEERPPFPHVSTQHSAIFWINLADPRVGAQWRGIARIHAAGTRATKRLI